MANKVVVANKLAVVKAVSKVVVAKAVAAAVVKAAAANYIGTSNSF